MRCGSGRELRRARRLYPRLPVGSLRCSCRSSCAPLTLAARGIFRFANIIAVGTLRRRRSRDADRAAGRKRSRRRWAANHRNPLAGFFRTPKGFSAGKSWTADSRSCCRRSSPIFVQQAHPRRGRFISGQRRISIRGRNSALDCARRRSESSGNARVGASICRKKRWHARGARCARSAICPSASVMFILDELAPESTACPAPGELTAHGIIGMGPGFFGPN